MAWSPTWTVFESAIGETFAPGGTRSSWRRERSAAGSEEITRAATASPPRNSTSISSMAWTTCAAVMTLPSDVTRTPEPVSAKRVWPDVVTSRPRARITATDGLTFSNTWRTVCAPAGRASQTRAGQESAITRTTRQSVQRKIIMCASFGWERLDARPRPSRSASRKWSGRRRYTTAERPPSKLTAVPVMYAARAETRNATRSANSSASPTRPRGTVFAASL